MGKTNEQQSKVYVLDTNIPLHEPFAFLSFQEHDVVIPMTVLEELDQIKDRNKDVSRDARVAIRALEDVLRDANPDEMQKGVPLPVSPDGEKTMGHLIIQNDYQIPTEISGLPGGANDNRIINCALELQKEFPNRKVTLVTKDINMRIKGKGAGLGHVEDYRTDQLIEDVQFLYKGYCEIDKDFWSEVKDCDSETVGRDTYHTIDRNIVPNAFVNEYLLDKTKNFAARVVEVNRDKIKLLDLGRDRLLHRTAWGVAPKNIYQAMALNALLDPELDLVILTGPAGCGKTGITASFFSLFVQTYLQTLFLLKKLSIYNRLRSNLSNMSLRVT